MDRGASSRLGRPLDLGGHGGLDKVIGTVKLHSRVDSPEFKFKFKVKFCSGDCESCGHAAGTDSSGSGSGSGSGFGM